jgi:glycosyltransferase involved in cell wall biosynthesis
MTSQKIPVSAIVIAKNEADIISRCLSALAFCEELIVVDNGSEDGTSALAKKHNAMVVERAHADFATLRDAGTAAATMPWVLFVDADEIVEEDLRTAIAEAVRSPGGATHFLLRRENYYLGKRWPHDEWMARLFSKQSLLGWHGAVHETAETTGPGSRLTGRLSHHTHRSLSDMVEKTNEWSFIEATLRLKARHPAVVWWRLLRVMATGFYASYISQGGWRAGTMGFIESTYQGFSMFVTYAKLWELQQKERIS